MVDLDIAEISVIMLNRCGYRVVLVVLVVFMQ